MTDPTPPEAPPKPTGSFWLIVAAIAFVFVLAACLVAVFARDKPSAEIAPSTTRLRQAYDQCGHLRAREISDSDRTLYLDIQGRRAGSGLLTEADLSCYLRVLQVPDYVVRMMENTRALDGRQSETWDGFEASWTYHPDDGLNLLITER